MIGIYKITSPSGKIYIGQSTNIERRFTQYENISSSKKQTILHYSFLKYGVKNHKFEILEECIFEFLNHRERHYQDLYNVLTLGLNCKLTTTKDKSGKHSEQTKLKIKLTHSFLKVWTGKKHKIESIIKMSESSKLQSIDTRNKISLAHKGKKMPLKTKEAIRKSLIGNKHTLGFKYSEEAKKKMSIDRQGCNQKIVLNIENGIFHYGIK